MKDEKTLKAEQEAKAKAEQEAKAKAEREAKAKAGKKMLGKIKNPACPFCGTKIKPENIEKIKDRKILKKIYFACEVCKCDRIAIVMIGDK